MKVLHALETFLPVSENWIHPQITSVPGVTPAVLCSHEANRELFPSNRMPLFRDPPPWRKALGLPRLVNSFAFRIGHPMLVAGASARRWRPQLIHAHFGMRGWQMLPLRRKLGVPMITSFYGIDAWMLPRQELWKTRLPDLFAAGECFVAEGPAMRERLIEIGCPPKKIEVVRLGIDASDFPVVQEAKAAPIRVAMMGRFVEKKGLPDGLRAVARAISNGADLHVTIIGDSTDEAGAAIKRELQEIARTPLLSDRVTFTGFLPPEQARAILRESHFFLCPSRHAKSGDAEGGSPLALTEAMAMGLHCIGTRHCDIPEIIIDGETGLLCDSGDVDAIAAALVQASQAPDIRTAHCHAGRTHIANHFSRAAQINALAALYNRVVGTSTC